MQNQLKPQKQTFYKNEGGYKLIAPFDGMKIPKRFDNIIDATEAFEQTTGRAMLTRDTDNYRVVKYRYKERKE